jgi:hypothetical protein
MQVPYPISSRAPQYVISVAFRIFFWSAGFYGEPTSLEGNPQKKHIIVEKPANFGVLKCLAFSGRDGCSDF